MQKSSVVDSATPVTLEPLPHQLEFLHPQPFSATLKRIRALSEIILLNKYGLAHQNTVGSKSRTRAMQTVSDTILHGSMTVYFLTTSSPHDWY